VGSRHREKLREAILRLDFNTIFGAFRVDRDGQSRATDDAGGTIGRDPHVLLARVNTRPAAPLAPRCPLL
jgi:hypothetical protein